MPVAQHAEHLHQICNDTLSHGQPNEVLLCAPCQPVLACDVVAYGGALRDLQVPVNVVGQLQGREGGRRGEGNEMWLPMAALSLIFRSPSM